jgi:hypothetical protein
MQPGQNDVHVDALLTNMSIAYKNEFYIAEEIFPVVQVLKQSDIVPKYRRSDWFRATAKILGPTEAPPLGGFKVDNTDTYYCHEYGVGYKLADRVAENTDQPYDLQRDAVEWTVDQIDLTRESNFVTNFWKTGVWGTDKVGTSDTDFTQWSTYANSTPIIDIRGFRREVRRKIARNPNRMVLGDLTWERLEDHPDMLDRIKAGSSSANPAVVNLNLLAQLFELEKVLVGYAIYTDDPEGTTEASINYSALWDDDAFIYYAPNAPSLKTPAAGYNFVWQTAGRQRRFMRKRRDVLSEKAWLIEAFEFYSQKITAPDAGLFVSDAVD